MLEDAKSLQQQSLKEKFTTNNRTKRCVPSDSRISPSVSAQSKSLRHAMDQGRTFCFDVIISATIFARRKSAGGNRIGLNQQRKLHASSRSFRGMSVGSFSRTAAGNRAYLVLWACKIYDAQHMICMKKLRFSGHPRTNCTLLVHSPGPTCNTVIACSHSQTCVQQSPLGNGKVTVRYKVIAFKARF